MNTTQYNLQFEKLCVTLQLGDLVSNPVPITGGLLHRMFTVETTRGKYAIKALNPQIMLRPTAMQNYINSEHIANIAARSLPAIATKVINGNFMQMLDGQYYLVFDWFEGRSLKRDEIDIPHCEMIGNLLAAIHNTDFSETGLKPQYSDNLQPVDWRYYLQLGKEHNSEWVELLGKNLENLYEWNRQAIEAEKQLAADMVISHRDLDPKNVMWNEGKPFAIDWEAAGFVNRFKEILDTAIYWSENENGQIDKNRFAAFIKGYKSGNYNEIVNALKKADWEAVMKNIFGSPGWLEYSLKRSLGIECADSQEQQLGTEQVTGTINNMRRCVDMIPELKNWLASEL